MSPRVGFIAGMSRAATSWLTASLNNHPSIAAFGETGFWGKNYVEPQNGRYGTQEYERLLARWQEIPESERDRNETEGLRGLVREILIDEAARGNELSPGELFRRIAEAAAAQAGATIALEKTPHHVHYLNRIFQEFPDAPVILMIREPYGFLLSYKHLADRVRPSLRVRIRRYYHPIAACFVYRGYATSAIAAMCRWPDRVMVIRFKDVQTDSLAQLERAARFVGAGGTAIGDVGRLNSSEVADTAQLGRAEAFWLWVVASRPARLLGYDVSRPSPASCVAGLLQLLTLPAWLTFLARNWHHTSSVPLGRYVYQWLTNDGSGNPAS